MDGWKVGCVSASRAAVVQEILSCTCSSEGQLDEVERPHLRSCCCQSNSPGQISTQIEETAAQVNVGRLKWRLCGLLTEDFKCGMKG